MPRSKPLKVLHVPYCWRPAPFGGTEHYTLGLWKGLRSLGVDGAVAAVGAENGESNEAEPRFHAIRDPAPDPADFRRELYGEGSAPMAKQLCEISEDYGADLVHFHSSTRLASAAAARGLTERGVPYIYTFHTPTTICLRGDLRLHGAGACDGRMEDLRCSACWLGSRGIHGPLLAALARIALPSLPGRGGTVSGARRLTESRSAAVLSFLTGARALVALCSWGRDVLLANGLSSDRIALSRHGLDDDLLAAGASLRRSAGSDSPATFVFLGRADRLKGADLFIEALRRLPGLELQGVLFLVTQGEGAAASVRELVKLAAGDTRIRFESEAPRSRILEALGASTACVVPSRWLETGPLVVLEAFAAGTPVVGTNLGGIAELVRDEENGLLFELEDVNGLARAIERLTRDGNLRERLRAGIEPPRAMSAVATEMKSLYERVLGR